MTCTLYLTQKQITRKSRFCFKAGAVMLKPWECRLFHALSGDELRFSSWPLQT